MTIYLYHKHCSHCGLKYFGRTEKKDPYKYNGSGLHWKRHIKKYCADVITDWVMEFEDQIECTEFALKYSSDYDIVESIEYANMCAEDGLHRGIVQLSIQSRKNIGEASRNRIWSVESRNKISKANTGRKFSEEFCQKVSASLKGKSRSPEHSKKISDLAKIRCNTPEWKKKLSEQSKGKICSPETKRKLSLSTKNKPKPKIECTHCNKYFDAGNLAQHKKRLGLI